VQLQLTPVGLWTHAAQNGFDVRPFLRGDAAADPEALLDDRLVHAVAALVRPARILEVGSGGGRAAACVLAAVPGACYVGVDRDAAALAADRPWLGSLFPAADLRFVEADSRHAPAAWLGPLLAEGGFDLVHLDGARDRAGVRADLHAALRAARPGGFVLVGDYDAAPGVRRAVNDFLFVAATPHIYCCGARGHVLINCHPR
jgi:predicted O-methyltransferase YrrM